MTAQDGRQRVFVFDWRVVAQHHPPYGAFVEKQIQALGHQHPTIVTEYLCQDLDADGPLFDARRQALMQGHHRPQHQPTPGRLYVATLDLAGPAPEGMRAEGWERQEMPASVGAVREPPLLRDYTVAWVFEVDFGTVEGLGGPTYRAVACLSDWGSPHFAAAQRSGGAGERRRNHPITPAPYHPSTPAKAFWRQAAACTYVIGPQQPLQVGLRWGVPAGATVAGVNGRGQVSQERLHDDHLMAAALVAEMDGKIGGRGESYVAGPVDVVGRWTR